jgi:hypothetical protein
MFGVAAVVIATWVSDDQTIADVRVNQESAGRVKDTVRMRKHGEKSYKNQNSTEYRIKTWRRQDHAKTGGQLCIDESAIGYAVYARYAR